MRILHITEPVANHRGQPARTPTARAIPPALPFNPLRRPCPFQPAIQALVIASSFIEEISKSGLADTKLTQGQARTEREPMKYPVLVREGNNRQGKVRARIYKPCIGHSRYRVRGSSPAESGRWQRSKPTVTPRSTTLKKADELAENSQSASLSKGRAPVVHGPRCNGWTASTLQQGSV